MVTLVHAVVFSFIHDFIICGVESKMAPDIILYSPIC